MNTNGSSNTTSGHGLPLPSSNDVESNTLPPRPIHPMVAEYSAAYDANQLFQPTASDEIISYRVPVKPNSCTHGLKLFLAISGIAFICIVTWRVIAAVHAVESFENGTYSEQNYYSG